MSMQHSKEVRLLRAARMLLDWTQHDLAARAGVTVSDVADLEVGRSRAKPVDVLKLHEAFERAGVRINYSGVSYINKKGR